MKRCALFPVILLIALPLSAVNLAVSSFSVSGTGVSAGHNDLLIDLFSSALTREKGVTLVERRNLDKLLKEIEFSLSDLVDSNSALRAGKLMGAAYILTGSLIGLGGSAFVSVQVIDNSSGAVALAYDKEIAGPAVAALKAFVAESVPLIAQRLNAGSGDVDLLWLTKSGGRAKPILIYIMSTVNDSQDPNGQWYYGPQHLAPVTDALRAEGCGVEIHDRRSLAGLSGTNLADYSQVWLLEGDGNNVVNPTPKDAAALYNFHLNGGSVWLSGENILNETDTNWVEDINAFADLFGARIGRVVVSAEPWLAVRETGGHPLLAGVKRLVFDNEVGRLEIKNRALIPLVKLDPSSRFLKDELKVDDLFKLADPARLEEARRGKKDWSLVWLLGKNAELIGPEVGPDAAGLAAGDERGKGKGRLIIDAGWLLGWAFNGEREGIAGIGDNLKFVVNAALWLAPAGR